MRQEQTRRWQQRFVYELLATIVCVGASFLMSVQGFYPRLGVAYAQTPGNRGAAITTTSTPASTKLAKHLQKLHAKMYGAYWCPHCHEQKQLFGQPAFQYVNYIECDPKGYQPRTRVCQTAKIEGFPTWEIRGNKYVGLQTLKQLAEFSGYQGSLKF
jgi:glutaredoxin